MGEATEARQPLSIKVPRRRVKESLSWRAPRPAYLLVDVVAVIERGLPSRDELRSRRIGQSASHAHGLHQIVCRQDEERCRKRPLERRDGRKEALAEAAAQDRLEEFGGHDERGDRCRRAGLVETVGRTCVRRRFLGARRPPDVEVGEEGRRPQPGLARRKDIGRIRGCGRPYPMARAGTS